MMSNKQKELGMIEDKNKRLNVIISGEFFYLHYWFNTQFMVGGLVYFVKREVIFFYLFLELNILSSLKGSDDVIDIYINDPQWAQEEIPSKLITVEENEVKLQLKIQ